MLLVVGHRVVERAPAAERLVEGGGAQLGVAERVADPLRGDRVLGVAGVADERPARAVRLAEEVAAGAAGEPLLACRAANALGELGRELERLEVVGLDVGLVRRRPRRYGQPTTSIVRPSLVGTAAQPRSGRMKISKPSTGRSLQYV